MAALDLPSDHLTLVVDHVDGTSTRWAFDEPDGSNIPSGLSFQTGTPGGHTTLTCELLRRLDVKRSDENLFDRVTVYGPGAQIVWRGRLNEFPRQTGDGFTVTPGAEGYTAALRDNQAFREIYVDRDLSKWTGPGVARGLALTASSFSPVAPSVVPDTSAASLKTGINDTWAATGRPVAEGWYDAQAIPIGSLYYAWKRDTTTTDNADTNWSWTTALGSDDVLTATTSSAQLRAAGPDTGTLTASGTRLYAIVQFYYNIAGGTAGRDFAVYWTCLAVYGNHGLTKRGTASATAAQGFYASDVIAHALSATAPSVSYTTGTDGSISSTSIVLEQLAFHDPTTAEEVIKKCNAVHLWDWGCWGQQFFFTAPDSSDPWQARIGDGAHLKSDGPTGEDTFNGVVVMYTDPAGQRKLVGPTGYTKAHATDSSLLDTSSTNPANQAGLTKWAVIQLSDPATLQGAINVGYVFLRDRSQPQRRGEIELTGYISHPVRGMRPTWEVKATDYIQITDTVNDDVSEPRRVIATTYDYDTRKLTATLGNTGRTLEALLELINAELVGRIS